MKFSPGRDRSPVAAHRPKPRFSTVPRCHFWSRAGDAGRPRSGARPVPGRSTSPEAEILDCSAAPFQVTRWGRWPSALRGCVRAGIVIDSPGNLEQRRGRDPKPSRAFAMTKRFSFQGNARGRTRWIPTAEWLASAAGLVLLSGCARVEMSEQRLVSKPNMQFSTSAVYDYSSRLSPQIQPGLAASGGARASTCTSCR